MNRFKIPSQHILILFLIVSKKKKFIPNNKDYHSCCNLYLMYQMCLKNKMMAYHKNIGFSLKWLHINHSSAKY